MNAAAQDLFQTDQSCIGKDILKTTRDLAFNNLLEVGLKGDNQEGIVHFDMTVTRS